MAKSTKKNDRTEGLLMPKATAVWLIDNTGLTFKQIAAFTGLHAIEVQALADEEVGLGIVGRNPVENREVTQEELSKAEADPAYQMIYAKSDLPSVKSRSKGPRYTPVSKRGDKPDAIAYVLKHHPEITDAQIVKLIGTTKPTINAIRERTHQNIQSIKPRHPVDLGLCTYKELQAAIKKGLRAQGKTDEEIEQQHNKALANKEETPSESVRDESNDDHNLGGFDFSNFLGTGSSSTNSGDDDADTKE